MQMLIDPQIIICYKNIIITLIYLELIVKIKLNRRDFLKGNLWFTRYKYDTDPANIIKNCLYDMIK